MSVVKKTICLIALLSCLLSPSAALASTDSKPLPSSKVLTFGSFFDDLFSLFKKDYGHGGNNGNGGGGKNDDGKDKDRGNDRGGGKGGGKDDDWRDHGGGGKDDDWWDDDKWDDWWEDCWGNDDGHTDSKKIWEKYYKW
ncbi:hypothetical protein [Paenibacillus antri]|uniref:hypothetical protein n=1 Tax=Paenibacillus antri TaxID=2582848 RepID=UPI00192E5844|nr:hypothetical protein [Paenibacillus antri]